MNVILRRAGAVALAALSLSACRRNKEAAPDLSSFPVRVEKARLQRMEETVDVVGSLKARDEAVLFSRVPGKLLSYPLKEGSPARKGDAVALVERDEVGVTYKPAPVPSPFNGVVARTYLDKGAHVKDDTPIALVIDPSEILARADVPERYAGKIRVGQDARVILGALGGAPLKGTVSLVSPAIDPATRSFPVEVRMTEGKGSLKSGMYGDVSVVVNRKDKALAVPSAALTGEDDGAPALFIVQGGNAARRAVRLGMRTSDAVEIMKPESAEAR